MICASSFHEYEYVNKSKITRCMFRTVHNASVTYYSCAYSKIVSTLEFKNFPLIVDLILFNMFYNNANYHNKFVYLRHCLKEVQ